MLITSMSDRFTLSVCILLAAILFSACGVVHRSSYSSSSFEANPVETSRSSSTNGIQEALYEAHESWQGTPYILGGSGPEGVDCSSFTQIVFEDQFDITLPRSTREQLNSGQRVRRRSIRPGDLIFFKTARRDLHVGIVMNEGEFLHASVSSGVMISSLRDRYWATKYLGARRVL